MEEEEDTYEEDQKQMTATSGATNNEFKKANLTSNQTP